MLEIDPRTSRLDPRYEAAMEQNRTQQSRLEASDETGSNLSRYDSNYSSHPTINAYHGKYRVRIQISSRLTFQIIC